MTASVTILYPLWLNKKKTKKSWFDWDYYYKDHAPLVKHIFGDKLKSYNVVKHIDTLYDTHEYHAIGNLYFDSVEDYNGFPLFKCRADLVNFTNCNYQIFLGSIVLKG